MEKKFDCLVKVSTLSKKKKKKGTLDHSSKFPAAFPYDFFLKKDTFFQNIPVTRFDAE